MINRIFFEITPFQCDKNWMQISIRSKHNVTCKRDMKHFDVVVTWNNIPIEN